MKIVKCIGGLGNQMFQYAFYKKLTSLYSDVKLDISPFLRYKKHNGFELQRIFNIKFNTPAISDRLKLSFQGGDLISLLLRRFVRKRKGEYIEGGILFDENALNIKGDVYYIGYWQSWRYLEGIEEEIRTDFIFNEKKLSNSNLEILKKIESSECVSIHVRRGDYLDNPLYENITTPEYYSTAISYIKQQIKKPHFFIFTNDSEWCRENLRLENSTLVETNNGSSSYIDMFLMSRCKHNIIANSSFSWWGAWLNCNPSKIIISPEKWLNQPSVNINDIIPPTWIRL